MLFQFQFLLLFALFCFVYVSFFSFLLLLLLCHFNSCKLLNELFGTDSAIYWITLSNVGWFCERARMRVENQQKINQWQHAPNSYKRTESSKGAMLALDYASGRSSSSSSGVTNTTGQLYISALASGATQCKSVKSANEL